MGFYAKSTTTIKTSPPNSSLVGEEVRGRGLMDFFTMGKRCLMKRCC